MTNALFSPSPPPGAPLSLLTDSLRIFVAPPHLSRSIPLPGFPDGQFSLLDLSTIMDRNTKHPAFLVSVFFAQSNYYAGRPLLPLSFPSHHSFFPKGQIVYGNI